MAITGSGLYGLTFEKMLIDTAGESLEAEDNKVLLVEDGYTPDFTAHDFRNDITNEVSGTGYSAGGNALTGTELTLSAGILTFDATDLNYGTLTVSNIMAAVLYFNVGASGTDMLVGLWDFVTALNPSNGNFTIQWNASGLWTLDLVP